MLKFKYNFTFLFVSTSTWSTRLWRTETLWVWVSGCEARPQMFHLKLWEKNKTTTCSITWIPRRSFFSESGSAETQIKSIFVRFFFIFFRSLSSAFIPADCAVQTGSSIQIRPQRPFFFFTAPVFVLQSCRGSWEVSLWCCAAAQHIDWSLIGG